MLPAYDRSQTYEWNFANPPDAIEIQIPPISGSWEFCGLPVNSPLGIPAGPLLNGRWCLYYASLGFDVVTYKTVRSVERDCYPLPNLQPVDCGQLDGDEESVGACNEMGGSWAVSFGMPSKAPDYWREDIRRTREQLPKGKILSASVVGTVKPEWSLNQLADDYAQCAQWAVEAGADAVESNFSCPNVSTCDGQLYQQAADASLVAQRVREAIGAVPSIVKIGHITEAGAAEQLVDALAPHVDALATTNSVSAPVTGDDGRHLFDGQRRGICGAATYAASIKQTAMLSEIISRRGAPLKLIGVGGARKTEHVQAYLGAGAHAVHLATAAMVNPLAAVEIRTEWKR